MAESEDPLIIPIKFQVDAADLEKTEERLKQGVTVPVRTDGGQQQNQPQGQPQPFSRESRTARTGVKEVFEEEIANARRRGDSATVRSLAGQAQQLGLDVNAPEAANGARPLTTRQQEAFDTRFENRLAADNARRQQAETVAARQRVAAENRQQRDEGYVDRGEVAGRRTADRVSARVDRSFDAAAFAQQKADERAEAAQSKGKDRNEERFQQNLDKANLSLQKAREREANAAERRAMREEERQQRDEQHESEGGGGASRGRILGLRAGRIGQLATIGFVGHESLRIADAYTNLNRDQMLAGNDQVGRLRAEQVFQDRMDTIPFFGPAARFLADPFGITQTATAATAQSAEAADRRGQQYRASIEYATRRKEEASISGFRGTDRETAEARIQFRRSNEDARTVRTAQSQADQDEVNAAIAQRTANFDQDVRKRSKDFTQGPNTTVVGADGYGTVTSSYDKNGKPVLVADIVRAENEAAAVELAKARAAARDTVYKDATEANKKILDEQLKRIPQIEAAQSQSAEQRGQGFDIQAQLTEIGAIDASPTVIASKVKEVMGRISLAAHSLWAATKAADEASRGSTLKADNTRIDAEREEALRALTGVNTPEAADMRQKIEGRTTVERRIAAQSEGRRVSQIDAQSEAAYYGRQRQPLNAQLAEIEGDRRAALIGVDDPNEQARINRNANDRASAAYMQRKDQTHLMDLSLKGRELQVKSLLARDQTGAQVAGIVAQTRAEEYQDLAAGFGPEAERARKLGQQQLDLTAQQYRDQFGGQEVSKSFPLALAFMPKYADDPGKVLKEIEDAKAGLNTAGKAEDAPTETTLKALLTVVDTKFSEFISKITN